MKLIIILLILAWVYAQPTPWYVVYSEDDPSVNGTITTVAGTRLVLQYTEYFQSDNTPFAYDQEPLAVSPDTSGILFSFQGSPQSNADANGFVYLVVYTNESITTTTTYEIYANPNLEGNGRVSLYNVTVNPQVCGNAFDTAFTNIVFGVIGIAIGCCMTCLLLWITLMFGGIYNATHKRKENKV